MCLKIVQSQSTFCEAKSYCGLFTHSLTFYVTIYLKKMCGSPLAVLRLQRLSDLLSQLNTNTPLSFICCSANMWGQRDLRMFDNSTVRDRFSFINIETC